MASAMPIRMTPLTWRSRGPALAQRLDPLGQLVPASATTSSGTAAPIAKATVRSTAVIPTRWVAPTTVMAARIGPAHGTKTRPRREADHEPGRPARSAARARIRAKGRSSSAASGGNR